MPEIKFQEALLKIKEGGKPSFIGFSLTRDQAVLIKNAIEEIKKRWDDYLHYVVEARLEL